jgi:hypothetical protein
MDLRVYYFRAMGAKIGMISILTVSMVSIFMVKPNCT